MNLVQDGAFITTVLDSLDNSSIDLDRSRSVVQLPRVTNLDRDSLRPSSPPNLLHNFPNFPPLQDAIVGVDTAGLIRRGRGAASAREEIRGSIRPRDMVPPNANVLRVHRQEIRQDSRCAEHSDMQYR